MCLSVPLRVLCVLCVYFFRNAICMKKRSLLASFAFLCLSLIVNLFCERAYTQTTQQITVADPTILYYNHTYYLYGTADNGQQKGFRVYTSSDKKNWKDAGVALKTGDVFGTSGFWAPQVFAYNNRFYMAYVANEHIAVAESESPLGPFTQKLKQEIKASSKMIDPFVFFDSGKIYLYHVRLNDGNRIYVSEMNADFMAINEETTVACIRASEPWENTNGAAWAVTEGPTVFKRNQTYYLFYSANDFRNPDYAVGYATSDNPLGPWKKFNGSPVLSKVQTGENGTGHGDFFSDSDGKLNYVFHTHESNSKPKGKRRTAIIEMRFGKGQKLRVYDKSFYYLTCEL